MRRHELSDAEWERIEPLLPTSGRAGADRRTFVSAVLWIDRTGAPWRDLPERFGNWNSIWRRYRRWCASGTWGRILGALRNADTTTLVLDSTVVRAHPCAAGAPKKRGRRASGAVAAGTAPRYTRR
jgi:transposase